MVVATRPRAKAEKPACPLAADEIDTTLTLTNAFAGILRSHGQDIAAMTELAVPSRLPWYAVGFADLLLVFFTLGILQTAGSGMVDDPGLGWHLRIADRMWESRGFIFSEPFCYPTEGQPAIAHAWLGDIVLRLAYGWGGLNGVAVLTALCLAWTLCLLYTRMTCEGTNWLVAAAWTFLAALGTSCSWLARPNVFTFPALVLVAGLCERYHAVAI